MSRFLIDKFSFQRYILKDKKFVKNMLLLSVVEIFFLEIFAFNLKNLIPI
jgi:hypothetical protein